MHALAAKSATARRDRVSLTPEQVNALSQCYALLGSVARAAGVAGAAETNAPTDGAGAPR
jgi:hypothetical protein